MFQDFSEKAKLHAIPVAVLAIVTVVLYWEALSHQFLVLWDDNNYVTANEAVRGLSREHLKAAFTRFYVGNYAPLQIISYMVDYHLWGMRPAGFIFTNILIHSANGILFYLLLARLSWRRVPASIAALIFLVHPVQVESVVWVSQRKNVLAMLLFLIAFYCYVLYRERTDKFHWQPYLCSVLAFTLSVLSKSVAVVFPIVIALFDLSFPQKVNRKRGLADKVPFLLIAVATALIAMKSQATESGGGRTAYHGGTPFATLLTMLPVFVRYLGLTLWPANLSAEYAPPIKTGIDAEVAVSALLLALIVGLMVFLYYRKRDLFFWLLLFFVGLLPVSQIVPLVTLMNDRYLYFPMLGAAALISAVAFWADGKTAGAKGVVTVTLLSALTVMVGHYVIVTVTRIPVWKDETALWQDALRTAPESPRVRYQYAHLLDFQGNVDEAILQYESGLRIAPGPTERYFLARLYEKRGLLDKAVEQYRIILTEMPGFEEARNCLALIYINSGMIDQAIELYLLALQNRPDWAKGHNNLAIAYAQKGLRNQALAHFERAVSLDPGDPEYHYNLGNAYTDLGLGDKGFREFETAARLDPMNPTFAGKFAEIAKTRAEK